MLILDGPDKSGKTTLANKIMATDRWRQICWDQNSKASVADSYRHLGKATEEHDHLHYYLNMMTNDACIQDRFHMSELVYRCASNEPLHLSVEKYEVIDAWLRLAGSVTVVLTADDELLKDRWDTNELYPIGVVLRANRLYQLIAEIGKIFCTNDDIYQVNSDMHFNLSKLDMDSNIDQILDKYEAVKAFNRRCNISLPYMGQTNER